MDFKFDFSKNKSGLGLLEMVLAVGLLALVSLGVMTLIENVSKSQRGLQAKAEQLEFNQLVKSILSEKDACTFTLSGGNVAAGYTVAAVRDKGNAIKFSVGQNDPSGFLKIEEFRFESWDPDAVIANQGKGKFNLKVSKIGSTNSVKDMQQKINLQVKTDASGILTECYAIGNEGDSLWQISESNQNNIFYSLGNVGVGTSNPATKLDVDGEIRSAAAVAGDLCSVLGAQAYDSTTGAPLYCNNSSPKVWTIVGGSPGRDSIVSWGSTSCPSKFTKVYGGKAFTTSLQGTGSGGGGLVCMIGLQRNLYNVDSAYFGYQYDPPFDCSVCADTSGKTCYQVWGSTSCASGFTQEISGTFYQPSYAAHGTGGQPVCKQGTPAHGIYILNSTNTGYEWITPPSCAVCCN